MKFIAVVAALTASLAMAAPTESSTDTTYIACPISLYGNAQCCATDILGLANLDCDSPTDVPRDAGHFQRTCADVGKRARCCAIPVLGQALLCIQPAGAN
nr:hydrophobin [Sodiomyces alkalinus]